MARERRQATREQGTKERLIRTEDYAIARVDFERMYGNLYRQLLSFLEADEIGKAEKIKRDIIRKTKQAELAGIIEEKNAKALKAYAEKEYDRCIPPPMREGGIVAAGLIIMSETDGTDRDKIEQNGKGIRLLEGDN